LDPSPWPGVKDRQVYSCPKRNIEGVLIMQELDELFAGAIADKVSVGDTICPSNADAGSFRHIEWLKTGDKLRFMGGPNNSPKKGDIVTVYRVLKKEKHTKREKDGSQIFRFDFTALFDCKDDSGEYLLEYPQDSRYYERAME
jgi:hypothetical protein